MGRRTRRSDRGAVTLVSRIFAPEAAAASFRLSALVAGLRAEGADVQVLTVRPPRGLAEEDVPGVDVRRAPVLRDATGNVRGYASYLSFDVPVLFRALFARRPDVFVVEPPPTTGFVVMLVGLLKRVPVVYYAADVWSDASASTGAPTIVSSVLRAVESWVYRRAATVIAISDGVAERVAELGGRRVEVVQNGIDTTVFTPLQAGETRSDDAGYLVYAGTASEWQGAVVFAEAMPAVRAKVPEARLVYIGQGTEWDRITALAAAPGSGIEVRGPVPPAEAAELQRRAAAALVSLRPGLGYDFAFPTKIYASLASGTPVVFAGPGPARERILDSDLGTAVDYDRQQVADAMVAALAEPPTIERRHALARWTDENASSGRSGRRAAEIALRLVRR